MKLFFSKYKNGLTYFKKLLYIIFTDQDPVLQKWPWNAISLHYFEFNRIGSNIRHKYLILLFLLFFFPQKCKALPRVGEVQKMTKFKLLKRWIEQKYNGYHHNRTISSEKELLTFLLYGADEKP